MSSTISKLSLATIGDLDTGAAGLMIDETLRAAIHDANDRGRDGKVRKVTIEIEIAPLASKELFDVTVSASFKPPPYRTEGTKVQPQIVGGELCGMFQKWSPENPSQNDLLNLAEHKEAGGGQS